MLKVLVIAAALGGFTIMADKCGDLNIGGGGDGTTVTAPVTE